MLYKLTAGPLSIKFVGLMIFLLFGVGILIAPLQHPLEIQGVLFVWHPYIWEIIHTGFWSVVALFITLGIRLLISKQIYSWFVFALLPVWLVVVSECSTMHDPQYSAIYSPVNAADHELYALGISYRPERMSLLWNTDVNWLFTEYVIIVSTSLTIGLNTKIRLPSSTLNVPYERSQLHLSASKTIIVGTYSDSAYIAYNLLTEQTWGNRAGCSFGPHKFSKSHTFFDSWSNCVGASSTHITDLSSDVLLN